jgi:hypothetical protein
MVGAGAGVAAVVLLAAGVAIGGTTMSRTKATTASNAEVATAQAAVKVWLAARPYPTATVAPGVDAGQGRAGAINGTYQVVGSAVGQGETDVWFVVVPSGHAAVGLTVTLTGGRLAAAPSVSPLPFGGGTPPPAAGGSTAAGGQAPATVEAWAAGTFGASGALTTSLGLGLAGSPHVTHAWSAKGGGTILRVQVDLSSAAPGTAATAAAQALARQQSGLKTSQATLSADQATLATDQAAVKTDSAAVTADNKAVGQDNAAVSKDQATVTADTTANTNAANALATVTAAANAANAANAAAAKAPAPTPPATAAPLATVPNVAPAQAAATAASQALSAAQAQLTKDQAQQTKDQAQQAKDQARLTKDQARVTAAKATVQADQAAVAGAKSRVAAAQAKVPPELTALGTYDLWVTRGQVEGWVPAGYQGH